MNDKTEMASAFRHLGVGRQLGAGLATSSFTWLSVKNKTWTLHHNGESRIFIRADDRTPLSYLDVVVVGENPATSRVYYINSYTEGASAPPDCASTDGIKPDAGVPSPQNPLCGTCRHNAFGTALNGGKGKACQEHKRIAVLLMPYMTEKMFNGTPLMEPVYLKIPPDSLKSWALYGEQLAQRKLHWAALVTRIGFAPDRLFRFTFETREMLTNREAPMILKLMESPATLNLLGAAGSPGTELPAIPDASEPPRGMSLADAFGLPKEEPQETPAPTGRRGRPPGSANKPKAPPQLTLAANAEPKEKPEGKPEGKASPWESADADLDERMKNVLGDEADKMMR